MLRYLKRHFRSPEMTPYELQQREKTLSIVMWVAVYTSGLLGIVDFAIGAKVSTWALFGAVLLCLAGVWLIKRGDHLHASLLVSVAAYAALLFNLIDGNGIHDSGVMAYPAFIVFGSLLFGKASTRPFVVTSIASLGLVAWLERTGRIVTTSNTNFIADFTTMSALMVASGVVVWTIIQNDESNLAQVKASEAKMRQACDLTLEGWAKALEYRDLETAGHSRRVTKLCTMLAGEFGYNGEELDSIRRGALLHDIGKMAIPDRVLLKSGDLNPEEWSLMQRHPLLARELLSKIPFLDTAMDIPCYHHEYWDGSGYPAGLKGEEIPFAARMFAVVDNWDALRSNRPQREAWTDFRAIDYLRSNAGSKFDPAIVQTFITVISKEAGDNPENGPLLEPRTQAES
jgi:HD-GYP domain-containing protein (c-di-GMP phosphodiesterase class II)